MGCLSAGTTVLDALAAPGALDAQDAPGEAARDAPAAQDALVALAQRNPYATESTLG